MPILKVKTSKCSVWRPKGTRYSQAREVVMLDQDLPERCTQVIYRALDSYHQEFGRGPNFERIVIEVVCATALVDVTVFELPEEN